MPTDLDGARAKHKLTYPLGDDLERVSRHLHYTESAYYHQDNGRALAHAQEAFKHLQKVITWLTTTKTS